ncbi:hypothetical protein [Pseudonocardia sp.]|uniref:hypothetical protein n=1 Tax=Pseudonocardia sp. TaxID=60912 RepID=UPI00260919D3|nr:hypothetical protein [Pseudonocardia sp.]
MRVPLFAGVAAGVGTTTLATALHGIDGGRYAGGPVDVLVCRACSADLARAAAVPGASVLALRTDGAPAPAARAWLDRIRPRFGAIVLLPDVERWRALDEPPAAEAARLLAVPADRRPRPLRPYADALLQITAGLVHDGGLTGTRPGPRPSPGAAATPAPRGRGAVDRPGPPRGTVQDPPRPPSPRGRGAVDGPATPRGVVHGPPGPPSPRTLWRGLATVERPASPRAGRAQAPAGDLDDDALESCEPARGR